MKSRVKGSLQTVFLISVSIINHRQFYLIPEERGCFYLGCLRSWSQTNCGSQSLWLPPCEEKRCLDQLFSQRDSSTCLARTLNGGGQESALEEHYLPQTVTQRYASPRGLATGLPPCRKGRAKQKGCFSLTAVKVEKVVKSFFISAPAQARSQDQIVSSMGGYYQCDKSTLKNFNLC